MSTQRTAEELSQGMKHAGVSLKSQRVFRLRDAQIRSYLTDMKAAGRAERTIQKYRGEITRFCDFLGEEQVVGPDSVAQWKSWLIQSGYAARSVNCSLTAVNGLMDYLGRRDWQHTQLLELPDGEKLGLSREEYYLLLETAKRKENIQLYLLVKVFACTDLTPSDIPLLTREAINQGRVTGKRRGGEALPPIPESLLEDLRSYVIHKSIRSGPVFLGSNQKSLDRTVVSKMISGLGEDAGLAPGKANPRNLRRLHLNTREQLQRQADAWVRESYQALLEEEEAHAGWHLLRRKIKEKEEI